MIAAIIHFCLRSPAVVCMAVIGIIAAGFFALKEIPIDAIPDIGDRQVIVYADWPGRSPQNVEDQVTYPLSVGLTGTPGVKAIRSMSGFGFAMVFLIFRDEEEWSVARGRVLERLTVLQTSVPEGALVRLGPDATALGQIFMYTVEGEGFDAGELRSVQDWVIRYPLQAVEDVAEVASVGGFLQQYQLELHPERLRAFSITTDEVASAVRRSNIDVGAKAVAVNGLEYFIRGVGFVRGVPDLENIVLRQSEGTPVRVRDVATVTVGPEFRRGALDRAGTEAVGGIVTIRQGANPREVVDRVKARITQISATLPARRLPDGRMSRVTIVPFYDRTTLIDETIETLVSAVSEELLVVAVVVFLFMLHLRTSIAILSTMPVALALAFGGMWACGVDANIMSIAGIAIAIGDVSDMGIIMAENIFRNLAKAPPGKSRFDIVYEGAREVGDAVFGAASNTIISFLPVFALTDQEGRLFKPLAYTKSFAIIASFVLAITVVPVACMYLMREYKFSRAQALAWALACGGAAGIATRLFLPGFQWNAPLLSGIPTAAGVAVMIGAVVYTILRERIRPADSNPVTRLIYWIYRPVLSFVLAHKAVFLTIPCFFVIAGLVTWLGFDRVLGPAVGWLEDAGVPARNHKITIAARHAFPGLGREFMPPLDEGSVLYMPSTLPGASLDVVQDVMAAQNRAIATIPEVASVVGKAGRAESPLDPAPISMIETVVVFKPVREWRVVDEERFWKSWPEFTHGLARKIAPDRRRITTAEIVAELEEKTRVPGVLPSWLQPIQARLIMLQTGFRAMMGVKIYGNSLADIETAAMQMETILRMTPGASDVVADRIVGKPYFELRVDREAVARHGVSVGDVQDFIVFALGGENLTTSIEGRERYPVRIRFPREDRDSFEDILKLPLATPAGGVLPLGEFVKAEITAGAQEIKTEYGRYVGYVTLNSRDRDEVSVVEDAERLLQSSIQNGSLVLPAGIHYEWAGQFENQVRSTRRLSLLVPVCLVLDLFLLYLSFRKGWIALLCFSAVPIAACGGFMLLPLWGVHLSVAVWVGFIALFGVAEDDAVVMSSYLQQLFEERKPTTIAEVRATVMEAGLRRIRPCIMTTATTVIGLIPVMTHAGRGSDVMQPMAIPSIGGMFLQLFTLFTTPCIYCAVEEWKLRRSKTLGER